MKPAATILLALIVAVISILSPSSAVADLTIFYDRSAWEAALSGATWVEDFEEGMIGEFVTPFVTEEGLLLESLGYNLYLVIDELGFVNGSRELHVRDYSQQLLVTLPALPPIYGRPYDMETRAMGFDWHGGEDWELHVAGEVIPLPEGDGFTGIVSDSVFSSFILTSQKVGQGGLRIDDLTIETSPVHVYTDRAAWEAASSQMTAVEDFESESVGTHQNPYTTLHDVLLENQIPAAVFSIQASGFIDGSHEVSFGGDDTEITVTPPLYAAREAVGFDWHTSGAGNGGWSCRLAGREIHLARGSTGFLGLILEGGMPPSFTIASTGQVVSITIDNLSYGSDVTPAERTTWGSLKKRY